VRTIRVQVACDEETCGDCEFVDWYLEDRYCELYDLLLTKAAPVPPAKVAGAYRCAQCVSGEDKEATEP
jgi:hypothetical protein